MTSQSEKLVPHGIYCN